MEQRQPRVSVVIPSFNHDRFIRAAIDSVLSQDYPYIECIVVDGGSKDDTVEVLKSYTDRIRWVSEPDRGESDAINKGIRMMTGDIYGRVNSDDMLEPGAVDYVVRYFEQHPEVDMIYGECYNIDANGNITGKERALKEFDISRYVRHADGWIPQPTAFIRRHVLDKVGLQDTSLRHAADYDLFLRIATQGFRVQYVPKVLARFRYHGENLTLRHGWRFHAEGLRVSARYSSSVDVMILAWRIVRHNLREWLAGIF